MTKTPAKGTAPVRVFHDTWDAEGERRPAGTVLDLPLDLAKRLIADGKAERADPMPGEE